jgi:hypothetical protein
LLLKLLSVWCVVGVFFGFGWGIPISEKGLYCVC